MHAGAHRPPKRDCRREQNNSVRNEDSEPHAFEAERVAQRRVPVVSADPCSLARVLRVHHPAGDHAPERDTYAVRDVACADGGRGKMVDLVQEGGKDYPGEIRGEGEMGWQRDVQDSIV